MKIHNVEQKSKEWFDLRIKYPLTASKAQAIGNNGKGLETLVLEKMAERYSFAYKENYSNSDTERGERLEEQARELYGLETKNKVKQVGFVTNEKISPVGGASPDGLVEEDGLVEIKALNDIKHFSMVLEPKIESKYIWQMQMQMLFTGRKWCDFVAYNPNFKKALMISRVESDKYKQEQIKKGLESGEKLIKEITKKWKN